MPKQPPPETYDQFIGVALMNRARVRGVTQADLARSVGLSERTFTRRMAGDPGFTVLELTAMAGLLGTSAGSILQSALEDFGGMDKLLSEVRAKNDTPDDDAGVLDNVTQLSRRESKGVEKERQAALKGKKESEQ